MTPAHAALRVFLHRYGPLPDADWARVAPCWHPLSRKRGAPVLAEGGVCGRVCFLEPGLARVVPRVAELPPPQPTTETP